MISANLKDSPEARLWFLVLSGLLSATLLASVVGAAFSAFTWTILSRPLAAVVITLLPATRMGFYRPYLMAASVSLLGLAQFCDLRGAVFYVAVVAFFLLVDPSLDALLATRCPENERLGKMAQLTLARSLGLLLGLLVNTLITEQPTWAHGLYSGVTLGLLGLFALVPEALTLAGFSLRASDPGPPRLAALIDSIRALGNLRRAADHLLLFSIALLAGSYAAGSYPVALLSPTSLSQWLSDPAYRLASLVGCAMVALVLERLSQQTLTVVVYPLLMLAVGGRTVMPKSQAFALLLEVACGLGLLLVYRHTLSEEGKADPCLRAALPVTLWTLGLLAGESLISAHAQTLLKVRWAVAVVILISLVAVLEAWRSPVRIKGATLLDHDMDIKHRGQGRHGDKTLDFTAAPEAARKHKSRWLAQLWYLLTIRFPVTVTLIALASFLLAGIWQVQDMRGVWRKRIESTWAGVKTELFLTSLSHRLEEEMLASGQVPTKWPEFVAVHFQLDGRPLKDRDFWGTPLSFTVLDKEVHIRSAGPDRKLSTRDDLERIVKRPDGIK